MHCQKLSFELIGLSQICRDEDCIRRQGPCNHGCSCRLTVHFLEFAESLISEFESNLQDTLYPLFREYGDLFAIRLIYGAAIVKNMTFTSTVRSNFSAVKVALNAEVNHALHGGGNTTQQSDANRHQSLIVNDSQMWKSIGGNSFDGENLRSVDFHEPEKQEVTQVDVLHILQLLPDNLWYRFLASKSYKDFDPINCSTCLKMKDFLDFRREGYQSYDDFSTNGLCRYNPSINKFMERADHVFTKHCVCPAHSHGITWVLDPYVLTFKISWYLLQDDPCCCSFKAEAKADGIYLYESMTSRHTCTGHCAKLLPDGSRYIGQMLGGKRHGHGKLIGANYTYKGTWMNDLMHGFGYLTEAGLTSYGLWRGGNKLFSKSLV
jgi:hypothetical protein